jgi:hypothetical protein
MNADEARERGLGAARGCLFALLTMAAIVLVIVLAWKFLLDYVKP